MTTITEVSTQNLLGIGDVAASRVTTALRVAICDPHPITTEGMRTVLAGTEDMQFAGANDDLPRFGDRVLGNCLDVLVLDKGFGVVPIIEWLAAWRASEEYTPSVGIVVWGTSISDSESLRLIQSGAKGILQKSAAIGAVLACLRAVAKGGTWLEGRALSEEPQGERTSIARLTARENQIFAMVKRGYRNREIATQLNIMPGTVKIHLKHIYVKLGVRGRYGLAVSGISRLEALSLVA